MNNVEESELAIDMLEGSEHYLSFIWELDIDANEKSRAIHQMLALTLRYRTWDIIKNENYIKERKAIIRSAKEYQIKKVNTMRELLAFLIVPHPISKKVEIVPENTVISLKIILTRWEHFDVAAMVDDSLFRSDLLKKPSLDDIRSKLNEIHDRYGITNKTYNIRLYLEYVSELPPLTHK